MKGSRPVSRRKPAIHKQRTSQFRWPPKRVFREAVEKAWAAHITGR